MVIRVEEEWSGEERILVIHSELFYFCNDRRVYLFIFYLFIYDFYTAYFVLKIEFFLHLGCNGVEARGLE